MSLALIVILSKEPLVLLLLPIFIILLSTVSSRAHLQLTSGSSGVLSSSSLSLLWPSKWEKASGRGSSFRKQTHIDLIALYRQIDSGGGGKGKDEQGERIKCTTATAANNRIAREEITPMMGSTQHPTCVLVHEIDDRS